METATIIDLENVTRTFREANRPRTVLEGTSLQVQSGEFIVLLGRSGSGKTTLLHLIAGIERADAGRVQVAGLDLSRATDRERTFFRRSKLGIIFQSLNLIPTLTVRENVELRLELNGALDRHGRQRAADLLEKVGLGDRGESSPDVLSGGEQQRVAIAAALAHRPEIVLADEPTGNLDAARGHEVVTLLDNLVRSENLTLIMATHSPEMIGYADRVIAIEEGRIIEQAPPPQATRES